MTLAGYRIPEAIENTMTLNFDGGADDIPTYSLADLRACAEKNDTDFFRRHFGGKVVLIGTLLDAEDRKLTSKRFATAPEGARAARCALAAQCGGRPVRAGFDRRRVCARDRRQQPDPPRRADRARANWQYCCRRCICRADGSGRIGAGSALSQPGISRSRRRMDGRRHRGLHAGRHDSARRAAGRRTSRARRDDRIPLRHCRQGQALAARELCALSRARGHRAADGVAQATGARRRDAHRHGVLLGSRRVLVVRRDDDAGRTRDADERVSHGDDRHRRSARRIRGQVHRGR